MKKSILEAVQRNGRHETQGYIYEKQVTPNGFLILRYNKYYSGSYPCVVYKQK